MATPLVPTGRSMADEAVRRGAIDLAQGVMHAAPPPVLLSLLSETALQQRAHVYTSPFGLLEYREAIASLLQEETSEHMTKDHVLGTQGVTGGLVSALIAELRPSDGVLLCEPFYPAHDWAIRAARCTPIHVRSRGRFEPDWDSLRRAAPQARALLIANPANPTGYVWSTEDIQTLIRLAEEQKLLLLIDEIYKEYIWEGTPPRVLNLAPSLERVVLLRGFSKTFAISGWRVGYAVSTPERIAAMAAVHDALYVGSPSLPQWVMARALRDHRDTLEAFLAEIRTLYRQQRDAVAELFRAIGMTPHPPSGAFYMLVEHHRADDMAAMRELLDVGVAVAPGIPFFAPRTTSTGYIRIHFAIGTDTLARVRERIAPLHK